MVQSVNVSELGRRFEIGLFPLLLSVPFTSYNKYNLTFMLYFSYPQYRLWRWKNKKEGLSRKKKVHKQFLLCSGNYILLQVVLLGLRFTVCEWIQRLIKVNTLIGISRGKSPYRNTASFSVCNGTLEGWILCSRDYCAVQTFVARRKLPPHYLDITSDKG